MSDKSNKPGRPKGSHSTKTIVDVEPSRCPVCNSTRRGEYTNRVEQDYAGEHAGKPYTHIVRRRTQCLDCGQFRIDRSFENLGGG